MRELTFQESNNVSAGVLPVAVIAVAEAISYVGGVAGAIAWLMSD